MVHGLSKKVTMHRVRMRLLSCMNKMRKLTWLFLKVDYHQAFTHYVNAEEGPLMNQLIIHQSILSNKTQKADEGFAINLQTFGFELMEKKYTFSGEKMTYLSTNVIESEPAPSLEENVKVVKKAAEKNRQEVRSCQTRCGRQRQRSHLRYNRN